MAPGMWKGKGEKMSGKKRGIMKEILSWVEVIVIAVVLALVINKVLIINATVPSGSMKNTIMPHSRVLGMRTVYWTHSPERGDIVVFRYPVAKALTRQERKEFGVHPIYVKRVIGLPGEKVTIKKGKIYINDTDTPLQEDYLPEQWEARSTDQVYQVPEGCYLMLGDNRNNSADSRYWAGEALALGVADSEAEAEQYQYVPKKDILGKAYVCYWPFSRMGSLY